MTTATKTIVNMTTMTTNLLKGRFMSQTLGRISERGERPR